MAFPSLDTISMRRKRLDLTQKQLATQVGISQSMLTKIERGLVVPSYAVAAGLFEKLEELERHSEKRAKDVMRKDVISLESSDTVDRAAKLARQHGFSQFPILKDGRIVGSITTQGMLDMPKDTRVGLIAEAQFSSVNEETPISVVKELLKHERAVVVVKQGKIVGIVTAENLL